jgi:hypothetical protein
VFITGPYAEHEIGRLLERQQCHVALFPSIAPETWCYTLTHALKQGLPIIAFELGAIAERLRNHVAAELLNPATSPSAINDALLRRARTITTSDPQKEFAMDPASTTSQEIVSSPLAASVQVLTLPVGTYVFTVQAGGATTKPGEEPALAALQVGLAPVKSPGTVEFLANARALDRWLARSGDMIIAKISGGSVALLLTSLRSPGSPALAIDVRPLEAQPRPFAPDMQAGQAADGGAPAVLPVRIVAHIQNVGDIYFDEGWAGCIGEKLWIEAFAVMQVGELAPDSIEYCGVTADGFQIPWQSNQTLCGSRGRGTPILGFAIRLNPDLAEHYECSYTGKFVSGSVCGPFQNGDLCHSDAPGDPLWGIELRVQRRNVPEAGHPSSEIQDSRAA